MIKEESNLGEEFNEEEYLVAFQIISTARKKKSYAIEATECAKQFKFEEADELLEKSMSKYNDCHRIQTELLTQEARGITNKINIIMVHAQDHLTMANMAYEHALSIINVYRMICEMGKEVKSIGKN